MGSAPDYEGAAALYTALSRRAETRYHGETIITAFKEMER
ncbi:hypothetical protein FACS1894110_25410 [Spirochaetia bacterium]|nr:hypothetical protein FACS1894110_25410 [Spirochaetia bacterium]